MKALFIGRFQPLHKGHEAVIRWLLELHDVVVIAIGSANESFTPKNPFTVGERIEMLHALLRSINALDRVLYCAVPDTKGDSALWFAFIKSYCPQFDIAYTNNEFARVCLEYGGVEVRETPWFDKDVYNGTRIRELMAKGDKTWRELVATGVLEVLDRIKAEERVRALYRAFYGMS